MKWWLGTAVLLLLALVLESGLLAYAMYVLVGVLLVSRLLARAALENVTARRLPVRETAEIGEQVTVTVLVRNNGKLPVPWILLEDLLPAEAVGPRPPRLKVEGKRLQAHTLAAGREVRLRYRIDCRMRGYYQVGPLVLESGDLFGLHRRYRLETEPQFLLVYPRVVPLEGYDLMSRRPIGDVRLTHRLYEDPTRIAGVRAYQAGDPLNRVHWRATARTGELHCKLYEPSSLSGATVVLDFHKAGYPRRGEPYRSELAVTAAAALAHAVYQMGQQVGLVSNGRDAADRLRLEGWDHEYRTRTAARARPAMHARSERLQPLVVETRRGVEQFQRIRETLARLELTDGLTFDRLVSEAAGRMPRDATVVALLPGVPVEAALALGNLKRQGFAVTVVLVLLPEGQVEDAQGRLLAEGVRDVRLLKDEAELPTLCQQQVLLTTPYSVAVAVE
jgi:uncharacterized repeat protein (TIGR01451 family)